MAVKTTYSSNPQIYPAVNEIKERIGNIKSKAIIYFASSQYEPNELADTMQSAFPEALTFGCTTAGELISGAMLKNSIVVMAFDGDSISDIKAVVMKDIKRGNTVREAFRCFESHFGESMMDMNVANYAGIILVDGLSGKEEEIMDTIGDLTNVMFVGGSAGDDLKFNSTYVFAKGKAYTNAALLVLFKPAAGFSILKTQSFDVLDRTLVANKVNEAERTVLEFNGKPAVEAYAGALGVSPETADKYFMSNPVGLMMGDEPYVRSPQRVAGGKMVFYCNVLEGMELSLLKSGDIVKKTRDDLTHALEELNGASGIINFHCILRTLQLENEDKPQEYADIFTDIPTIGFSTYGEEYIGHINQTSTMLLIK
jgi:hypothetical protein